jgi:hypothetical protein
MLVTRFAVGACEQDHTAAIKFGGNLIRTTRYKIRVVAEFIKNANAIPIIRPRQIFPAMKCYPSVSKFEHGKGQLIGK